MGYGWFGKELKISSNESKDTTAIMQMLGNDTSQ